MDDLEYFNSKVNRGLRIPTSFLLGPEEGGATFNDQTGDQIGTGGAFFQSRTVDIGGGGHTGAMVPMPNQGGHATTLAGQPEGARPGRRKCFQLS